MKKSRGDAAANVDAECAASVDEAIRALQRAGGTRNGRADGAAAFDSEAADAASHFLRGPRSGCAPRAGRISHNQGTPVSDVTPELTPRLARTTWRAREFRYACLPGASRDEAEEVYLKVDESEVRQRADSRCFRPMAGVDRLIVAVDSEH